MQTTTTRFPSPLLHEWGEVNPRRCYHALLTALEGVQDKFTDPLIHDPEGLHESLCDLAEMAKLVNLLHVFKGE